MIPVVAPPLDEPPTRLRWFRTQRETAGDALQRDQLAQPTDDQGGGCASSSHSSSRTPLRRRWSRTAASLILMGLIAGTGLAAGIRLRHGRASQ